MMTKTIEQFDVLDTETLASVQGGDVFSCILGTAGSAGLGFLGGVSAGTVTIPIVGTVSGAGLGAWAGAATGAATFCRP